MGLSYDHGLIEPRELVGLRVEIPTHYDYWMRGARFGVVTGWRKGAPGKSAYAIVKSEHPQVKRNIKLWKPDIPYAKVDIVKRNPVIGKRNKLGMKKQPRLRAKVKVKQSRNTKGRNVRLVKRNPSKRAYAITGMDRYGNKWYFTGTGFDRSRKLILTFPSKASAEYRMGEIVNQLPHQIDTITLADA